MKETHANEIECNSTNKYINIIMDWVVREMDIYRERERERENAK